jgi:two-component system, NtrC family, response regulator HydG
VFSFASERGTSHVLESRSALLNSARVLVVDDEPEMLEWLRTLLASERYDVRTATRGSTAREIVHAWEPSVVVSDLLMPDMNGLSLLASLQEEASPANVILLTGHASVATAVEAMRGGAFTFVEKPVDPDTLLIAVKNAAEQCALRVENQLLKRRARRSEPITGVVGRNRRLHEVLEMLRHVAPSEANCLIVGESGTGKEVIANAIHALSTRARGPFIKVNCAAIPADLVESELFGHRKGAFTGAVADRGGLFEQANGGSILLDEVGEMPPYLQTKLLRVLQERAYRAIGSDRLVRLDVRLICATNVDVQKAVQKGRLREDLFFRINTITLNLPPLRERIDDLPILCEHFLERFRTRHGREVTAVSKPAMHQLQRYAWPGNVRELENVIERGVLLTKGSEISLDALPENVRRTTGVLIDRDGSFPSHLTLAEIEKMAVIQALQRTAGNKLEAAQTLGLYRPTLYSKIRRHAIDVADCVTGTRRRASAVAPREAVPS